MSDPYFRAVQRMLLLLLAFLVNGALLARGQDIVINEIMYHPASQDPRDEFIELHNREATNVNLTLTESQSLRLSLSRTLARPEYRELSPIISRDVIGGDNVQGDPELERTRT